MADMSRRDFVKGTALVGGGLAVGSLGTLLWKSASDGAEPEKASPVFTAGPDGQPYTVRLSDLNGPAVTVVTAMWGQHPAVVYKVPKKTLQASTLLLGYNTGQHAIQHPSEPDHALVAYDGRCTHLGCTVGWHDQLGHSMEVEDYDGDGEAKGRALCPCHQSQFDLYDLGRNQPGGPAPRPLPVLSIELRGTGDPEIWARRRIVQDRHRGADEQGDDATFQLAG